MQKARKEVFLSLVLALCPQKAMPKELLPIVDKLDANNN